MEQPESMEPATAKTRVARSTLIVAWTTLFRTSLIRILKTKFAPGRREQCGTHVVAHRETWQQRKETGLRSWKTDRRDRWKNKQGAAGKKRGRSAKLPLFFRKLTVRPKKRCMIPLSGRLPTSGVGHVFARVEMPSCDCASACGHQWTC